MDFIEIEESIVREHHDMRKPHSHEHYELYFLLEGERVLFIDEKMFPIKSGSLVVVPPFSLHKTEGGPYRRINVNISENLLSERHLEYLKRTAHKTGVRLEGESVALIYALINKGAEIQKRAVRNKKECLLSLAHAVIDMFALEKFPPLKTAGSGAFPAPVTPETLKILTYINENFSRRINLKVLCSEFYMSKVTLCKMFRDVMGCSVMKYVHGLRINKAKEMLINTDKSVEEISDLCGFSSANYFGLTFKKETGMSPFNYKKSK